MSLRVTRHRQTHTDKTSRLRATKNAGNAQPPQTKLLQVSDQSGKSGGNEYLNMSFDPNV